MAKDQQDPDPDALRVHFGQELRRLRNRAKLSMSDLAQALGCTPQWICQLEHAEKPPSEQSALDLDTYFQTDGHDEDDGSFHRLHTAIRRAGQRRVLRPGFKAYLAYESKAIGVRCFAAQIVPGLLQTEDYARAIMDPSEPPETLDARVAGRMERQSLLTRDKPAMTTFVLDESVLRRPVGGHDVMAKQVDHLTHVAQSPYAQVLVMPFVRITPQALSGDLIVLNFEKERDLVYVESGNIGHLTDDSDESFMAGVYFNMMIGEALNQAESIEFMLQAREAYL